MNIVHYHTRFDLSEGGVMRAVVDLVAALASKGHAVTVITHDPKDAPVQWRSGGPGLPRLVVIPPRAGRLGHMSRQAVEQCTQHILAAHVLHMHTPWESTNPQLARVARSAGIPYVVSIHGMLDDWCMTQRRWKKRIYHALAARRLLEQAAFVHCTATAELEQAKRWFPRGKGRVVPLVFDLEPFKTLPGPDLARSRYYTLSARGPKVLFLSRLHPKKGVELLIDAVSGLRKEGADLTLTIAGTGEPEYVATLKQRATKLGDRAEFLGMVSGQDKLSVYQAADVLVIPTSQENFGFVFPEALACGTPVVTTKGVDIWPELQTSGGAVIVEPEPRQISAALRKLFMDPAALKDMGAMGRRWVFQELDGARVVERYEALYAEAAGPSRSNT